MCRILKILPCIFVLSIMGQAQAFDYDPLLMRAQASIFPKIILLDKDLENKVSNNEVIIEILHSTQEKNTALKIKELIEDQYKNNLGKNNLIILLKDFESFDGSVNSTAYIMLRGTHELHKKVTSHAASQQRLVFSYDHKDFENNSLISMLVKEKTYIYLNKPAIHDYDIKFLPLFYKIVKVIE